MELKDSMFIAASGMRAQGERMKVISENLANANSTADTPDDLPYRRQVVTFSNALDEARGIQRVEIGETREDDSEFRREYQPGHPAADADGYVLYPNVNSLVELNDMRQAQRSYEANLNVISTSRQMMLRTIGMLRGGG